MNGIFSDINQNKKMSIILFTQTLLCNVAFENWMIIHKDTIILLQFIINDERKRLKKIIMDSVLNALIKIRKEKKMLNQS